MPSWSCSAATGGHRRSQRKGSWCCDCGVARIDNLSPPPCPGAVQATNRKKSSCVQGSALAENTDPLTAPCDHPAASQQKLTAWLLAFPTSAPAQCFLYSRSASNQQHDMVCTCRRKKRREWDERERPSLQDAAIPLSFYACKFLRASARNAPPARVSVSSSQRPLATEHPDKKPASLSTTDPSPTPR